MISGIFILVISSLICSPIYAQNNTSKAHRGTKKFSAYIYSIKNISQPIHYSGWPTVAKLKDGRLFLVYSGGRKTHVDPYGRTELRCSSDNGKSWSKPKILVDSILDDRDAGICQTNKGTILVTWFTSLAWLDILRRAESGKYKLPEAELKKMQQIKSMIDAKQFRYPTLKSYFSKKLFGTAQWMIRSGDGGKSWSEPYSVPAMSPHGPIAISDGRLLLAGKNRDFIGLWESRDDGITWKLVSKIKPMKGQTSRLYHELHIVEAANGTLIVHIRNHNKTYYCETLQTESRDGGKSWSEPHSIGVWGYPSHLLRLSDDKLLMSYGYRGGLRNPKESNRVEVRISEDNGVSWSAPIIIADNLSSYDFGYPSTVELGNGKLLTVWYEVQSDSSKAVLRQAIWKIVNVRH